MATVSKTRKKPSKIKEPTEFNVSLPATTTTIELGGIQYFVTPVADMVEWLEDMEDIIDSYIALNVPGERIPIEQVLKDLGIKLPKRKKK